MTEEAFGRSALAPELYELKDDPYSALAVALTRSDRPKNAVQLTDHFTFFIFNSATTTNNFKSTSKLFD